MPQDTIWFGFLAMIILLVVNGFFVAVEFALVALRSSRVKELVQAGNPAALVVEKMQSNMDVTIAGAQLGITLASLALGWVAEETIQKATSQLLKLIPETSGIEAPAGLGIVFSFILLSMMHVIIGEQVPKSCALRFPERMLFVLVWPFQLFCTFARPLILLMNFLAASILKVFGMPKANEFAHAIGSPEEYEILFNHSNKAGTLPDDQHQLLNRSLKLPDYIIEQLMVPRSEIDWIDIQDTNEEILMRCVSTNHSRLPVANGGVDEFLGIVQVQDILCDVVQGKPLDIDKHLHQPLFVPGGKSALLTLQNFQASQCGVGVILDEFGGVRGLFTINDIVSAALGENPALLDDWAPQYHDVSDNEWVMEGTLPLEEFEEITGIAKFPEVRKPYHTLAGLILAVSQHIPAEGEVIKWDDVQFKVLRMDRYRLAEVKVKRARKGQQLIAELESSSMTA
jgi:Hemolysins and related proteins containing CBS domains